MLLEPCPLMWMLFEVGGGGGHNCRDRAGSDITGGPASSRTSPIPSRPRMRRTCMRRCTLHSPTRHVKCETCDYTTAPHPGRRFSWRRRRPWSGSSLRTSATGCAGMIGCSPSVCCFRHHPRCDTPDWLSGRPRRATDVTTAEGMVARGVRRGSRILRVACRLVLRLWVIAGAARGRELRRHCCYRPNAAQGLVAAMQRARRLPTPEATDERASRTASSYGLPFGWLAKAWVALGRSTPSQRLLCARR